MATKTADLKKELDKVNLGGEKVKRTRKKMEVLSPAKWKKAQKEAGADKAKLTWANYWIDYWLPTAQKYAEVMSKTPPIPPAMTPERVDERIKKATERLAKLEELKKSLAKG